MELRHLRYFVAVAEELHFGRAAERLGLAQPPLSQQIKALEQEAGVVLLDRTKRRVKLTAAGEIFLQESRKILALAEQAVLAARRAARGETGKLVVGFVSSAVYGKVTSIFRIMQEEYPDVSLLLQDLSSIEQVEAMKAYRLDIGLILPPVETDESLITRVIWREPLVVVLPRHHRLAGRKKIAIRELAEEPFLLVDAPGFLDQLVGICALAGFSPGIVQQARSTPTIVNLIAAGIGISIVPASLRNLHRQGVIYRSIEPPAPTIELALMWRKNDRSPALRSFLEIAWRVAGLDSSA
ncbi:MAG: LysR substrate-binding domain-containing protein [Syntrophobacteraceae bacterium]|nr:LysR substrate-binding domain-containing protein [Syntrophobacteraceae bacterium]